MKIPLSTRLSCCCDFINKGDRVADIGCDHGYLGIYLLSKGIASHVIAADINEGPLQSAKRNADKFGVANKMEFYLSDGVQSIPRDFDAMVCAGMGGDTMVSILSAASWLRDRRYRLILQCQSKTHLVRQYLLDMGWVIENEVVVRDGRFLYTVISASWQDVYSNGPVRDYYYSPCLLESPTPESIEYYHRLVKKLRISVGSQGENADVEEETVLSQLEQLAARYPFLQEETK
ncbi:MAG: SAM-dependent methyltransferase [Oscillospiraceae bacterium]|nr:SAM-dependent methyltransferase [Oscillospiraceae bacterium]